ncbi:MAG: DUF58 domain-containing protein [Planctomycetota bacterium]
MPRRLDEDVLACLGRIGIAARQAVEHLLLGHHRGLRRGLSVAFVGHRAYEPGDDLRHLDWQVLARTDRLAVRVFEEETRLRATLLVDSSMSMRHGEGAQAKHAYARVLSSVLATIMILQGDSISLALCDQALRRHIPAGSSMAHLMRLLQALEASPPRGGTDLLRSVEQLAPRLRRRGLVVVVSDGGDDGRGLVRALQMLRYRRQDVYCFLIDHPEEQDFPFQGPLRLLDWESGAQAEVDADNMRTIYCEQRRRYWRQLEAEIHAAGVRLTRCRSDEPVQAVLLRAFGSGGARERMR